MIRPKPTSDEPVRLAALQALKVLDTPAEERFDRVTRLARRMFGVPIALVSLVDENRQWFKSRQGLDATETPREISFCGHAIHGTDVMVVPDTEHDQRFADNPLVADDPRIRFYAGYPLSAPDGSKIGTVCIIDREPRQLGEHDLQLLRDLGQMVEQEFAALALATIDGLTGLSNRRGFEMIAEKALAVCRRQGDAATLLFFDLDRFKAINDEHGHAAGDGVLGEMAELLQSCFRESDVVSRLGGDEFCVLLTGAGGADLKRPLMHFDEQVDAHNARAERPYALEYSVGLVTFDPGRHAGLADLLHEADVRMYENKRKRGRARAS